MGHLAIARTCIVAAAAAAAVVAPDALVREPKRAERPRFAQRPELRASPAFERMRSAIEPGASRLALALNRTAVRLRAGAARVRSRRSSGARRSVAWRNALVGPRLSASIRPPRSLPSSAALGRLAIDLAAALLSAIATTLAFDGNGWIAWAALAPLLIVCGRTSAARAFAIGLAFGALTTLGVERPVPFDAASGVAHALSLLAHASLYPAIACATLPLLVRSRLPLAITVPALWVLLDQLAAGTGAAVLPSIGLAATQHDNLSMAALSVLSGEAGVTALIVGVNVAVARLLAEPLRGWPTALGMSMIVAGVQVGVVVPIAWQAPSPSAGVAVLAIVAIPAIVLALAALARAESGDRR